MSHGDPIREGQILTGPPLSEPTRVEPVTPNGLSWRLPESELAKSSRIESSPQSSRG